ncbi:MAG: A/G-specific adenine glycosylase [Limnohabitans sp.]|nr:A/G-specific adenine glycosylase [Limnohabitans sp.]
MSKTVTSFAQRLVNWQRLHGRHDLPWQNTRDPYRVWLSEIMLQQTQVVTVLGYYQHFLTAFPDVKALAAAHLDQVLGLWSGLGYYSRARNLHACAQQVAAGHGGVFPQHMAGLQSLKGIGPSTAAAIASLCFDERVAILDGNVKRVLTRHQGFALDLSSSVNEKKLQTIADQCLPLTPADMPAYTQGIMDLGATLCTRSSPACPRCPVRADCVAMAGANPSDYPVKIRKLKRAALSLWLLCASTPQGEAWLAQRPATGVWAGLYTQPLFESEMQLLQAVPPAWRQTVTPMPAFVHVLTHKDLHLLACHLSLPEKTTLGEGSWFTPAQWSALGLPAPVRKLLAQMPAAG